MRVLVCGGRCFNDYVTIYRCLDDITDESTVTHVIVGGADGADYWGEAWAYHNHVPFTVMRADWKSHGRAAGPLRNQRMIDEGKPDLVVAFPGGRGTADMVRRAKDAGVKVVEMAQMMGENVAAARKPSHDLPQP
jgi:hypothetical protein